VRGAGGWAFAAAYRVAAPDERRQILQLVDAFIERGQLKRKVQAKQPV